MATSVPSGGSTLIPCLRYRDAPAAIDWLCRVFGFEKQLVVPGENNTIMHAQLKSSHGMLMLGSVTDSAYQRLMKMPDELNGMNTQSVYLVVPDADAVYKRVQAAGVPIDLPIQDEDYGGRGFTCRDPEGHVWSVGSYDPWQSAG
jgi:uncharacterized glyoxalase superfamily protein PhnB